MPPKKAASAPKKSAGAAPAHGSYQDMVKEAIINLKERNGSSRQAIKKYIKANNKLGDVSDAMFTSHVNRAIQAGVKNGQLSQPKGASGTVKLGKKDAKPTVKKESEKKATATKKAPAKKKTTTTAKKPATTKKTTAKSTKATTTKKAAGRPKANAGKPRKAAAPAPAIDAEVSRVLGKTKGGRVVKSKAPAAEKKAPAKKAAAPKKKATPKKAAPKKATPKKTEA